MFNRRSTLIDGVANLPPTTPDPVLEGAATPAQLNSRAQGPGSRLIYGLMAVAIVVVGGLVIYEWQRPQASTAAPPPAVAVVRNNLPALNLPAPATPPSSVIAAPPETITATAATPTEPTPQQLQQAALKQRRLQSALPASTALSTLVVAEGKAMPLTRTPSQPASSATTTAYQLADRHWLLTQGTVIDCVLLTRLITSQPGLVTCLTTRDVYSANGRVVLLDRGSRIVGHYSGGLHDGQQRIAVMWSRLETPHGIVIDLDAPSAGPLGEAGLDGTVDSPFWARFGHAILLSLFDDARTLVTQQPATVTTGPGAGPGISITHTQQRGFDLAQQAIQNQSSIDPTLYKNQGERITIIVTRDLDFRHVYDLQAR